MIDIRTVYSKTEKSPALSTLKTGLLVAVTDSRHSVFKVSLTVNLKDTCRKNWHEGKSARLRFRRLG